MGASKTRDVSVGLENVRRRFERWRETRRAGSRIPGSLWAAAVRMAGTCGLHRTARALRLDYYSLKERVEQQATASPASTDGAAGIPFLELAPSASLAPCDCTVEWEDAAGAKMRVHLKGTTMPDLAALGRSFWR
jgi:hypothetical protein